MIRKPKSEPRAKAWPNNCASPQLLDESDRRDVLHRKRLEQAGLK